MFGTVKIQSLLSGQAKQCDMHSEESEPYRDFAPHITRLQTN